MLALPALPPLQRRLADITAAWLAALLSSLPATTAAQPRFDDVPVASALTPGVRPLRTALRLNVDPARDAFDGRAVIDVQVDGPVPSLWLHAAQLEATSAQLRHRGTTRRLHVEPDADAGRWRLLPIDGRPIGRGTQRLELHYRGRVQTTGSGLFSAAHRIDGRPARMLATQLQAVHARQVFPSFDEPAWRMPYTLSVRAPAALEVVSNMPRQRVQRDGRARVHHFAPTPAMPSYLLALAVGRFDVLAGHADGVPLRILTPPGRRDEARFALQATQRLLPWLAHRFGQPYGLPKLDQLAVPGTRQGAMEDWGLVSYVEDALLLDPQRSGPDAPQQVFGIVAHELAHQWFGNLVSVASWDEIWLNEAFATWMETQAAERFHPEWQAALRARLRAERVLARDATPATRAIRSGPVDERRTAEVFDDITYVKGGAVLSMLEQWLGPATFQRGLAAYMAERAMKPATAADLWHHIEQAAGEPVRAVAASWTDQPGHPLLQLQARCEGGRTTVRLAQARWSTGGPLPGGPWLLPVLLARGDERHAVLLRTAEHELVLPGCAAAPLRANAGGHGFYRVAYDADTAQALAEGFAALPPADRVALLSDSFALASAGRQPMAAHFALLRRLPAIADDSRPLQVEQALRQLDQLDAALQGSPAQAALRAAAAALFAPELDRLGWVPAADEGPQRQRLRAELIEQLAAMGHAPTRQAARERFGAALRGPAGGVPASLRGAVLYAVGTQPSEAEFDALLDALRQADSHAQRRVLAAALAAGQNPARAQRLLAEALSGRLPPDLAADLPGDVAAAPGMAALAYDFVLAHWDALSRLSGDDVFGGRPWLLPGVVIRSNDAALAARLAADQRRLVGDAGRSAAQRALAAVDVRVRLREREGTALAAALADWRPTAQ